MTMTDEFVYARVTRYREGFTAQLDSGYATEEQPIWVRGRPVASYDYEFDHDEFILGPLVPADKRSSFAVTRSHDLYEIVAVDDLPDEVLVELTRRALSGEGE
jgi:hypothetical protein